MPNLDDLDPEVIVRVLSKKPGWKENNFQVMTKLVECIDLVAKSPSFSAGTASLVIPGLADKIGDIKVKKVVGECLCSVAEATAFGFVLSQSKAYW